MPYALCPMPYALDPRAPHVTEKGYRLIIRRTSHLAKGRYILF
ncbi:hypothetical protein [Microcoleus sp.]